MWGHYQLPEDDWNGALGIGADNALGGNSIVLGDNDEGLNRMATAFLGYLRQ
uniref:hypothetical protein n=1 Tax=Salmonella sp. TaxID=599 RepID=UPI0039926700